MDRLTDRDQGGGAVCGIPCRDHIGHCDEYRCQKEARKLQANGNIVHELKCWPEYYEEIHKGNKNFEVRNNDRNFKVGDVLYLKEYDPKSNEYTGRETRRLVTYILNDVNFVKEGMVVMSLCRCS